MDKKQMDFMEVHALRLKEMKMYLGKLCLDVRKRNKLSREYVADQCGVSERSIAKIEQKYTTSIDLVNTLFKYYNEKGYITREEQEQCSSKLFI